MPEQYTITGTITSADGAERAGIKVQAFDRDLPSLEERRMGSAPQMLKEAIADAEGRFQITYTLEQFSNGEGISQFRRVREQNADLSFRAFDRVGQELSIRRIETLDHEYRSDQIIFNAPPSLEVSIFLDAPREAGTSEYEQLMALIAPAVEDLPLAELSDEDIVFLTNEVGLEQQRDVQQHIEWLRRSALLAQGTTLPVESFYGWGRKDVPARFIELAALPLNEMPRVFEKLAGLPAEELRAALLAAVEENIIPARLGERAGAIVNAIHRSNQQAVTVRLRLEGSPSREALAGYMVTTLDLDAGNRDLGTDVTDVLGEFEVVYFANVAAPGAERSLRFRVRGPAIPQGNNNEAAFIEVTASVWPGAAGPVNVPVPLQQAGPTLLQLRDQGHLDLPDDALTLLEKKHNIRSLADIRRMGGLNRNPAVRALDLVAARRLDALADLERLSDDLQETSVLFEHDYDSVFAIADTSLNEFVTSLTANGAGLSEKRATELHIAAKAQTDLLDQIFAGIAVDYANGIRPATGYVAGDYFPPFPQEQEHD